MSDNDSIPHRSKSKAALSLLRRSKSKASSSDVASNTIDDAASDDGSHASDNPAASSTASRPPRSHRMSSVSSRFISREHSGVRSGTGSTSQAASASTTSAPAPTQAPAPAPAPVPDKTTSLESSVRKFRIVEALRSGNTASISKAIRETSENAPRPSTSSANNTQPIPLDDTTVLHLSIQCAETDVVEYVLSDGSGYIDINARDKDGNTPLHIAASQGRGPIVRLLLEQKDINDAIPNHQNKLALDVARSPEIFQQLQLARTLFVQDKVKQVQDLVRRGSYDALGQVLEETRVRTILDVNSTELPSDPLTTETGGTLLHEAARKKDTKLIQALLLHGADPFQRDRKGKLPQQVTTDDSTRSMLKRSPAAVAAQRSIQEKAVLGHATSQAGIAPPVAGDPSARGEPTMKGYLKKWTNYRKGYQLRWFVLENGVLSYYKHQDDADNACRGAISMRIAKLSMSMDDKTKFEIIGNKSSVKYTLKANHEAEAKRWFWALNNAIQWMKDQAKEDQKQKAHSAELLKQATELHSRGGDGSSIGDATSEVASVAEPRSSAQISRITSKKTGMARRSTMGSISDDFVDAGANPAEVPTVPGDIDDEDDDDEDYVGQSSVADVPVGPSKDAFNITAQSAKLQLDTLASVSAALQAEAHKNPQMSLVDPKASQALATYDAAIKSLKGLMGDLLRISKDRDAHWQYRLDQETEMRRMWEESMAKVAAEQEILEQRAGQAELKHKMTKRALREFMEGSAEPSQAATTDAKSVEDGAAEGSSLRKAPTTLGQVVDISEDSESEQEEFFDAVDAGEIDVEPMPPSELVPSGEAGQLVISDSDITSSFKGYENGFRTKLGNLDDDNRPRVGLWGILKSMIGKDMTKMTLPVSFNEPTSFLYRTGEDMEYASLLNKAAERSDSAERMLYVAAFASSEFASTIGRVAKPFNPLLGETFEYCRPDVGYRFFIEQVSHHPPIGASFAEAPNWTYYGEANIKNKFLGKSFDIYHVGTWFLKIRPTCGGKEELYTWKKPMSQVVGIITGNPTVDNFGLVEIKNHTTGETCKLDFKQRGWKASSAYQLAGKVMDANANVRFSIGGRWNSKIYARSTPGYEAAVEEPKGQAGSINDPSRAFVIWEANFRPEKIPFNLTPFVLTFNQLDDNLKKWIAPTDSRYRPDQRAMEEGEWDLAAEEKNRMEEGQRTRRKLRERDGGHFEPAWFTKETCETTGEEYWKFTGKYWEQRDKFGNGDENAWDGLERIFEEPEDPEA